MRVLVCGGRDFADRKCFFHRIDDLDHEEGVWTIDTIIHGGCKGADLLAAEWAGPLPSWSERILEVLEFKADWDKHGRSAGPIRNQQMLDEGKPDLVLAFAGGKGTDDMCRRAREAGVEVRRFWPGKS